MFRQAQNPLDESVAKATDENLTTEDWSLILDVVDKVQSNPSGPQQAVSALIKRLAHRNANVQLYTLELANALSQNCGAALHRELASKAFTDALLRLAADRNAHGQVKQKIMERMGVWTEEFGRNPEFGIMEQAYQKLRLQQPGLMPPSKPVKQQISDDDRRKEEQELAYALELSVKQEASPTNQTGGTSRDDSQPQPAQSQAGGQQSQQGTTAATVSRVRALYDFTPGEPGELAFRKNDIIAVLESVYKDWWRGSLRGQSGIFPLNYVEKLQDPTKEEIERDAQMEAEVFGEIKNVEKLLALLSVRGEGGAGRRDEREEEEITSLYQRTLSIRPKLIELIGKYSQKKDDMTQLNEKFIKARRDYETLLDSSMSQPQYQPQQQFPIHGRQPQPYQMPPQQRAQQPPYSASQAIPPPGYPPQGPPSAQQAYPPQQPFSRQSQMPPPQQDVQRYYSPAPSEPASAPPQAAYNAYPPQNGPPSMPPSMPPPSGPAPFHFIPGGIHGPPPVQQEIRRKPSPQIPLSASAAQVGSDPYSPQVPVSAGGFQGQIRPNSIHTLNSGAPQELSTGGYESPVDNRHSYPQSGPPMQSPNYDGYDSYETYPLQQQQQAPNPPQPLHAPPPQPQHAPPPAPQQAPQARPNDRDALPSRVRHHSFESPTSMYSSQQNSASTTHVGQVPWSGQDQSEVPASPNLPSAGAQQYQAYQAYAPQQQQRQPSGGSGYGAGEEDYYR